jgi:hypothetical protein
MSGIEDIGVPAAGCSSFTQGLGIGSSLKARKELANELGCPAEQMGDSARMNMWLHRTVLGKIAENGNLPKELLN